MNPRIFILAGCAASSDGYRRANRLPPSEARYVIDADDLPANGGGELRIVAGGADRFDVVAVIEAAGRAGMEIVW